MSSREGIVLILSAPSGTGKTTLIRKLLRAFPDLALSISYTTRSPRQGEVPGKDYHFVAERRFKQMRGRDAFAEWAVVHGSLYGTPRRALEASISGGRDILLDIDVQGAKKIKRQYPRAVSIFLLPPSWRELERRLALRGTDRGDTMRQRLHNARREIEEIVRYDYYVINSDLREAFDSLRSIVIAERHRISRVKAFSGRPSAVGKSFRLTARS